MKAVLHRAHGGIDQLCVADVPTPEPGPGEALLRVEACALNHLDVLQRRGPALIPGFSLPHVAGMDIAGTVVTAGAGVAEGDRVVVNPAVPCEQCAACREGQDGKCERAVVIGGNSPGGYAEYVVAPVVNLHPIPDGVSFVEAAAVPTVWMTAWHALVEVGRVAIGETVLIHAGSSGVSTAAIQLAKAAGARVITTVSTEDKVPYARKLGADLVIDASAEDVVDAVRDFTGGRGVELVIDHVGPTTFETSIYSLAACGRLVFLGNTTGSRAEFDLVYAYHFGLRLLGSDPYDRHEFGAMLDTYWASDFVTPIDSEFALADGPAAQARMESRRATGKIVLRP